MKPFILSLVELRTLNVGCALKFKLNFVVIGLVVFLE